MEAIELADLLEPGPNGLILANKTFTKTVFSNFVPRPPANGSVFLQGVYFDHCEVKLGTCMISPRTTLQDVVFNNFKCGDAMRIAAEAPMRNVTIQGKRYPRMLWIKRWIDAESSSAVPLTGENSSLDISGYLGEVSITGILVEKIRINPELHVKVYAEKMKAVDWASLESGRISSWRIAAQKAAYEGSGEGVFSLPSPKSRNYERSMAELKQLRDAGYL